MFSLRVLGGALLEGPNGPVRGRPAHRRRIALLALLASSRGRPIAREKVIGLLWPEHPGDAARHLLSESLYVLRKALGDQTFVAVGDEIALNPQVVESDAAAFEAAVEAGDPASAVALYRGPFLDGFYLSGADEFERWVEGERARLARVYAQALERLAESAEETDDFLGAVEWWRRVSARDPYSSRVVLRLMRALESGGEHTAALRAATEHADFLREDLGAQPDPAVPAYAERLRTTPPPGRIPPPFEMASEEVLAEAIQEPGRENECEAGAPLPHASYPPDGSGPPVMSTPDPGAAPHPSSSGSTPAPSRRYARVGLAILSGLAMLMIGEHIGALHTVERKEASGGVEAEAPDPRRIAVLYFDDHSPRQDIAHLASGLTEGLIHELAQVPGLDVISRNGVKPYRDGKAPLDSITAALRVGTLVEGSVQRSGDRLRVTVQLVDAATGGHLQSRTIERPMGELFALEDELAREVSESLRQRLGKEIRLREHVAGTRSTAAREAVLRAEEIRSEAARLSVGHSPLGAPATRRMLATADSLLAEAARSDPRWARPWILRGWVALSAGEPAPTTERRMRFAAALRSSEWALEIAPTDPAALELRGTVRWRMVQRGPVPTGADPQALSAAAERDLNQALANDPSLARAWVTLSQLLRVQEGRLAEADVAARRALEADEFLEEAPLVLERLYRSNVQMARFDSAAAWCARGRARFPNDSRFVECRLTLLGYPGTERADVALAWRLFRELEQMDPPGRALPYTPTYRRMAVARVVARAGLADSARAMSLTARAEVRGNRDWESAQAADEAYVRLLLGERDSAVVLLSRHLAVRPRLRAQIARDVKYRALHDDPRFRRLVAEAPEGPD